MKQRRLLLLALLVGLAVVPGGPARAESTSAQPEAEAWYAPSPTCASPLGCLPLPPLSSYPAGTMHVGVRAGVEEARTYLRLALGGLPSGSTLTGGTLTIPIAGPDAGTLSPETATVAACYNFAPFQPAEGSTAPPPGVDCTATSTATFNAGTPATLTIDLTPFVDRWGAGEPNDGIALLPAPGAPPGATWHVAFASGSALAALEYDPAPVDASPVEELFPVEEEFVEPGPFDVFVPPAPVASADPIVEQAEAPERVAPVFSVSGPGFAYPAVFAVPLLLLALGGYLGWALTRPIAVPEI